MFLFSEDTNNKQQGIINIVLGHRYLSEIIYEFN